jgi:hypothetical protein
MLSRSIQAALDRAHFAGSQHQLMIRGTSPLALPNPHRGTLLEARADGRVRRTGSPRIGNPGARAGSEVKVGPHGSSGACRWSITRLS